MHEQFTQVISAINAETNLLATKLTDIQAKLQTALDSDAGLNAEQAASALADLQAISTRLTTLAADPQNPVPTVPQE